MFIKTLRLGFDADEKAVGEGSLFLLALSSQEYDRSDKENPKTWVHYTCAVFAKDRQAEFYRDVLKKGVKLEIKAEGLRVDKWSFENGKQKIKLLDAKIGEVTRGLNDQDAQNPAPAMRQGMQQPSNNYAAPQQQPQNNHAYVAPQSVPPQPKAPAPVPAASFDDFDDDIPF